MRFQKLLTAAVALAVVAFPLLARAAAPPEKSLRLPVSLSILTRKAHERGSAAARVSLLPETSDLFKDADVQESGGSGHVANYLRALATMPNAIRPMAKMTRTVLYGGSVAPEVKMAMGLRIAQLDNSAYVAAHLLRLLNATQRGRGLVSALNSGSLTALPEKERLPLDYALAVGRDPNGYGDADFARLRGAYNDSQIVEIAVTTCYFSYLTHFCEGLNLPAESWAMQPAPAPVSVAHDTPLGRVALLSDAEIAVIESTLAKNAGTNAPKPSASAGTGANGSEAGKATGGAASNGLGIAVFNSQRAMVRAPELMTAWFGLMSATRESQVVSRADKLHISFAVSMANGCRYCTLHQVLGLKRVGVDVAKLQAMEKDDSALTPHELVAVQFARKLTRNPSTVTDGDYRALVGEFTEPGALEALLQTCTFQFMNRFTDGLRLPSEDEAVKVYSEIYGADAYSGYHDRHKSKANVADGS